jgi:hypothetical protein
VEYDAIIDGHPDDWEVIIREGVRHTDTISKDIKKYYDPECIRFLEEIIEKLKGQIYMTSIDLWFRIGDILIWERPESKPQKTNEEAKKSHATYIFKWPEPEQPLDIFIAIIWSYKFDYNRKKYSKTGCIKTINHTYEDKLKGWKSKLIDIILKKSNTKGNIKSLIDEIHT